MAVSYTHLTGTAKGMGGDVTVTLTLEDGKITGCTAEGKDETPGIGTLALDVYKRQVGEPAEYDSGVVFGKGEADLDVEEDVQDVSFTFAVEHPALWSAEQPNLYEAEIALLREGCLLYTSRCV